MAAGFRHRVVLTVVAVTVSVTASAQAQSPGQDEQQEHGRNECVTGYENRPGTGYSCRTANGLYRVRLRDDSTIETHGPDGFIPGGIRDLPDAPNDPGTAATLTDTAGVCVPVSEYRIELVYAVPQNKLDRYDTMKGSVQTQLANADSTLNLETGEFGYSAHYRVLCDGDGTLAVKRAVLPTASTGDSFSTIVSDLKAQGFNDPLVQYWVFYDDGVGGFAGQGEICWDDALLPRNCNNTGPKYAISYGSGGLTLMHESGHNMGAVQLSAPNSSGAWHCNDEDDRMCYADGGSKSNVVRVCTDKEHFDCRHDDYFHPNAASGNYLFDHWNVGSCLNRFIDNSFCVGGAAPTASASPDAMICLTTTPCSTSSATATDPDGDLQSYDWSWESCVTAWSVALQTKLCPPLQYPSWGLISGSSVTVPNTTFGPLNPGFFEGVYTLKLTISDRKGHVTTDIVVVTIL